MSEMGRWKRRFWRKLERYRIFIMKKLWWEKKMSAAGSYSLSFYKAERDFGNEANAERGCYARKAVERNR